LKSEYASLEEIMTKVFKQFDKDNSGFIDLNELSDVSKELGRPLDAAELEECMKDLDLNKDNQISFDEFRKWWLSGRQGLSQWMRRLLAFKLKSVKFFGNISSQINEVVAEASAQQVDINTSHFSLNINKVEHAGLHIYSKLMILSNEVIEEYSRIRGMHKFDDIPADVKPWVGALTLEIKDGKAAEAQAKIQSFLSESGLDKLVQISVVVDGHNNIQIALPLA
jgi:hypothetical protein